LSSPEDILVDIYVVYEPHGKAEQDSSMIVQMIEEEMDCFFDDIAKPGPISAPKR